VADRSTLSERDRLLFEEANVASLATVNPDGSPQVSPVWVDLDGDHILINSSRGRVKVRNIERDPRVAVSVFDRDDPESRVLVRGRVVEVTEEGAVEHIHALSRKYYGEDFTLTPDMVRVVLVIRPERVAHA
jgi:PPOX class probable F420-dependent enzyme